MSYTFGTTGGTCYGYKSYNQIFAINSETGTPPATASNYWDKSNVLENDTVICSENNIMLTARYIPNVFGKTGGSDLCWFGTGIYLAYVTDNVFPGDYLVIDADPAPNYVSSGIEQPPAFKIATSIADRPYSAGVALAASTLFRRHIPVATFGLWPVRMGGIFNKNMVSMGGTGNFVELATWTTTKEGIVGLTQTINNLEVDPAITNPTQWQAELPSGTIVNGNFPMIRSTNTILLDSDYKEGNMILLWGTKNETI
jgi:hypothetical protein